MKIDREKTFTDTTRADQVRSILQRIKHNQQGKPTNEFRRPNTKNTIPVSQPKKQK